MKFPSTIAVAREIDPRTFWELVGERSSGAAVVAARDAQGPAGFLALSATHLSADPPMMMVGIDKRTSALGTVLEAAHFAISYLPSGTEELAQTFSRKGGLQGADRFEEGRWRSLMTGAPVLTDAAGAIDCALEETIERHGTVIAIGRVVDFCSRQDARPLIFYRGGYLS